MTPVPKRVPDLEVEGGELDVDDAVVPRPSKVGCRNAALLGIDRVREKFRQDIAPHNEIGRPVRPRLGVTQDTLMDDGHALYHELKGAVGLRKIPDVLGPGRDRLQ